MSRNSERSKHRGKSDEGETHRIRHETSSLQTQGSFTRPFGYNIFIFLFRNSKERPPISLAFTPLEITSTHHHPITQRPAASCVGQSHLDTLLSPKPTCLTMLLQHLLAVALTSFFPPNFLYDCFGASGTRSTEKYV